MFEGPRMRMLLIILSIISLVLAQTTRMITVGDSGSFYDPPNMAAGLNDTIVFVFNGQGGHSVTQSSYNNPCTPLPGGFNSGLYSLNNSTDPNDAPVWSLQITDVVDPIYFFCSGTRPQSHCASGMVGIINPPSQANYSAFVALAKNTTTLLTSQPPYAASGIGASALATPSQSPVGTQLLTATDTTTVSASFTQTSNSSTPTATGSTSNLDTTTKSHTGAIVGGAVGGSLAIGILIVAVVYMLLRRHRQQQTAPSHQFPNYYATDRQHPPNAGPPVVEPGMNERIDTLKPVDMIGPTMPGLSQIPSSPSFARQAHGGTGHAETYGGYHPNPYPGHSNSSANQITYTVQNPDPEQGHQSRLLASTNSDQMSLASGSGVGAGSAEAGQQPQQIGGKDINTLAKEIAAVLIQNNAASGGKSSGGKSTVLQPVRDPFHTASPPRYREQ